MGKYPGVWILLLGPSIWGPGWWEYFRQISGGTPYRMACILVKHCPTFRSYSALAQISLYSQLLNNNTIPFCPFTLWTSGPTGPPRRRPPPLCACDALFCGKQYKPTGLRVVAPQAHTESGPTEALWGAKAFAPFGIESDYHLQMILILIWQIKKLGIFLRVNWKFARQHHKETIINYQQIQDLKYTKGVK